MTKTTFLTTISPMLSVREAAKAVEFYKKAFGAVELHRVSSPNGDIVAELAVDDARFSTPPGAGTGIDED